VGISYSYDPAGNLAGVLYLNAVQSTYSYDALNRLTGLTAANGTTIANYGYTLGPAGNRPTLTEAGGRKVTYDYDALYRLTGETITGDPDSANGAVGYTLDAMGNRLTRMSTLAAVPPTANTFDDNDHLSGDSYDLNGNTSASGANTYAYDFENRLKQMNPGSVSILYDGDGNRVGLTADGTSTTYLVDTTNPTGLAQVLEEIVGGVVKRVYTYGLTRVSQSQLMNGSWATSFYGYDGQGSVRFLTNSTGAVTDRYTYDAFGNQLVASGATSNVNRYMGEAFDPSLQLTYLRARYLNPASGRFWNMDSAQGNPFDPPSLHKYLYANGDPVNGSDPLGLFTMGQGTLVHKYITWNFLADGLRLNKFGRFYGTGKGATSLGRVLRRGLSPGLVFPGSRLFPDLIDIGDHFMIEIKTTNTHAEGVADMDRYLRVANANDQEAKRGNYRWRPGTAEDFKPFGVVPCDTTWTCLAFIHPPDADGVLTYDPFDLKPCLYTLAVLGEMAMLMAPASLALAAPFIVGLTELAITVAKAEVLFAAESAAENAMGRLLLDH
jgi:RHS repeat-associated protein